MVATRRKNYKVNSPRIIPTNEIEASKQKALNVKRKSFSPKLQKDPCLENDRKSKVVKDGEKINKSPRETGSIKKNEKTKERLNNKKRTTPQKFMEASYEQAEDNFIDEEEEESHAENSTEELDSKSNTSDEDSIDQLQLESDLESNDSDAPEELGFHDSKNEALSKLKHERKMIVSEELKKKNKRKLLQEKYIEQKQSKFEALRIPDNILNALDDDYNEGTDDQEPKAKKILISSEKVNSSQKIEKKFDHGSTTFKIYDINDAVKKPYDASEDAASFRDRMTNRKHIVRESVSTISSKHKKQEVIGWNKRVKKRPISKK